MDSEMLLTLVFWIIQALMAGLGVYVSLKPQPPKRHLLFIVVFGLLGISGLAVNLIEQKHSQQAQAKLQSQIDSIQTSTATRADVKFLRMAPNPSTLPFRIGQSSHFNIWTDNEGNESATDLTENTIMYIAPPGDQEREQSLSLEFENQWDKETVHHMARFQNGGPLQFYTIKTPEFTAYDLAGMKAKKLTLYLFHRSRYHDHAGEWESDTCLYMQVPIDFVVAHPCAVNNAERHRVVRQH